MQDLLTIAASLKTRILRSF